MPGKTGPIERRLRAVYSQVASSIVTRVLRLSRAGGLLVYPVVGHSHVPWTGRPSGGDTPRGRRPEGSSSAVDVAASGCGASEGLWAGDGCRSECQRED